MVAEGFCVMDWRSLGLEERSWPQRPTRSSMVIPRTPGVHAEPAICGRFPAFPQGVTSALPGPASELRNHLRPDRDHPDEQRDRCQRRSFFHENLQHGRLLELEHMKNIVPFLF